MGREANDGGDDNDDNDDRTDRWGKLRGFFLRGSETSVKMMLKFPAAQRSPSRLPPGTAPTMENLARIHCTSCKTALNLRSQFFGKAVRCPTCKVSMPPYVPPPPLSPPPEIGTLIAADESDCLVKRKVIPTVSGLAKLVRGLAHTRGESRVLIGVDDRKRATGCNPDKLKEVFDKVDEQLRLNNLMRLDFARSGGKNVGIITVGESPTVIVSDNISIIGKDGKPRAMTIDEAEKVVPESMEDQKKLLDELADHFGLPTLITALGEHTAAIHRQIDHDIDEKSVSGKIAEHVRAYIATYLIGAGGTIIGYFIK